MTWPGPPGRSVAEPGSGPVAVPSQRCHRRHASTMHADHCGEAKTTQTTIHDGITAVPNVPPAVTPHGLQPVPPALSGGRRGITPLAGGPTSSECSGANHRGLRGPSNPHPPTYPPARFRKLRAFASPRLPSAPAAVLREPPAQRPSRWQQRNPPPRLPRGQAGPTQRLEADTHLSLFFN